MSADPRALWPWRVEVRTSYGHWALWARRPDRDAAVALRAELRADGKSARIREETLR